MVLISQLQQARPRRVAAVAALFTAAVILAGCSAANVADTMPTAIGGLPETTPQRPATPAAFPAVHALPPKREDTILSYEEQKKLEDDLIAARNRATGAAGVKPAATAGAKPSAAAGAKPAGAAGNP
jgi:hypothetical protein